MTDSSMNSKTEKKPDVILQHKHVYFTCVLSPDMASDIIKLYREVNEEMGVSPTFTDEVVEKKFQQIGKLPDNETIYVAIDGRQNVLAGMMHVEETKNGALELSTLSVLPQYRRMKLGTYFVEIAKLQAEDRLHLTCFGKNKRALAFYETTGYTNKHVENRFSKRDNVAYSLVHFEYVLN